MPFPPRAAWVALTDFRAGDKQVSGQGRRQSHRKLAPAVPATFAKRHRHRAPSPTGTYRRQIAIGLPPPPRRFRDNRRVPVTQEITHDITAILPNPEMDSPSLIAGSCLQHIFPASIGPGLVSARLMTDAIRGNPD